ncbi:MAG TPA: hypothetical protein VN039_15220, partial [Nitrospira sp.]|nr:hypothetical protein [Nitrospira sp.]
RKEFEPQMFPPITLRVIGVKIPGNFYVVLQSIECLIQQRTEHTGGQRLIEGFIGVERFRLSRPNRSGQTHRHNRGDQYFHQGMTVIFEQKPVKIQKRL